MPTGYLVSLGDDGLDSGDAISGSPSTFTAAETVGTGSWTWSGVWSGDGQTYNNVTDTGTYYYGADGNTYFVPDNWYPSSGSASTTDAPANTSNGTAGNESISGDGDDNVIYGGDGDDYLVGSSGNDLIFGGDGNDNYDSDLGDDTFYGEGGDDWVALYHNMEGESVYGGETDETLGDMLEVYGDFAGADVTVTFTGDGDGTVSFGNETAYFWEFERFYSHSGDDTIDAAAATSDMDIRTADGDNLIIGGAGGDTLRSGSGSDTVEGGAGDDEIDLGADSDRDTLVTSDGAGADTVYNFDLTDSGDGTSIDQFDVSNLTDSDGNPVSVFDVVVTDTNGDGTGDAILSFPNGESVTLVGVQSSQVSSGSQLNAMGIPCFTAGTMIRTPGGEVAVDRLRPGDLVQTREFGAVPVRWVARSDVGNAADPLPKHLMPVRIKPGTLGNRMPLVVSPQHCILMQDTMAGDAVYVRAKHLAEETCIASYARRRTRVRYVHVLFDAHATLLSNGVPSESFYPGPTALKMLDPRARARIFALFPELAWQGTIEAYGPTAAKIARRCEVRRLARQNALAEMPWEIGRLRTQQPPGFMGLPVRRFSLSAVASHAHSGETGLCG